MLRILQSVVEHTPRGCQVMTLRAGCRGVAYCKASRLNVTVLQSQSNNDGGRGKSVSDLHFDHSLKIAGNWWRLRKHTTRAVPI
jgi:hypothetical protein